MYTLLAVDAENSIPIARLSTPISRHLKCAQCDYDLINLFPGDPCPECGTEIIVHAPSEGVRRFENDPASKLPSLLTSAGIAMIFWFIYGSVRGIPPLEVLIVFFAIPIATIALVIIRNGERRLAVTLDWNGRRVIFERCYRSNAYWLSLRRMRVFECSMDEILAAEVQRGRGRSNLRVITPVGIANVPDTLQKWDDLRRELVQIAADTPDAPRYRSSVWLMAVAFLIVAIVLSCAMYWALVIDPV